MSNALEVNLIVKTKESYSKLATLEQVSDRVMSKVQRTIEFVRHNTTKILRTMDWFVSNISNVFKVFGLSIGVVGEAVLGTISTLLISIIQMQAMLAAGTGGVSLVFGVGMIAAAFALSIVATTQTLMGIEKAQSSLDEVQAGLASLRQLGNIWW